LSPSVPPLRLVIFDWAGTTIDHGCFAPLAAFVETFARHGVHVTAAQARGPMGLHKKDHLRAMFQVPEVARCWREANGRDWDEQDLEKLYLDFMPLQLAVIDQHSRLVSGLEPCISGLRRQGNKIGATTGYFRAAAERVYGAARDQGFVPDCCVCAEDVAEGRPAPWMVYRVMETMGIYPPSAVVKVGDTVPDIGEGLNAGAWSIGVTAASSAVGCTEEELAALPADQRCTLLAASRSSLLQAGAHAVIDTLAELPALLADIAERLRRGEKP
jgi:phosphonoacetaldehyde hydrolase